MYEIIVGRNKHDISKFGKRGTILLGKQYVKMEQSTSLAANIHLDVSGAHVMFICGKRGGGKSYTMGVFAEGFAMLEDAVKQNISVILLDTMGIYWTMKYGNKSEAMMLEDWDLKPKGLDVNIYTPEGFYKQFKEDGIPTDFPFSLDAAELNADDWCLAFRQDKYSENGVLITRAVYNIRRKSKIYTLDQLIDEIKNDARSPQKIKDAVENMFSMAKSWGTFSNTPTKISDLAKGGEITVLDLSCYATMPGGWDIKSLVVGIVGQHLFTHRMKSRKYEEYQQVHAAEHYFSEEDHSQDQQEEPLVWLVIDEAHEFLPKDEKVASTDALVTIMREGRQPGISLVLATQQPGKIHTDVMTQSDIVLAHRITAKIDTDALGMLMQSYMREGLTVQLDNLPREKGAAIIFDDANEKMFPIKVRPRFTWHGGSSPNAVKEEKNLEL